MLFLITAAARGNNDIARGNKKNSLYPQHVIVANLGWSTRIALFFCFIIITADNCSCLTDVSLFQKKQSISQ